LRNGWEGGFSNAIRHPNSPPKPRRQEGEGAPLDNRIENLEVMEVKPHMQLHKQIYPDTKTCANCGEMFTVNPRKRKRSKCCSPVCAQAMRVRAALAARGVL
jgi:formylmethanofuran dehydrogenase subunit E